MSNLTLSEVIEAVHLLSDEDRAKVRAVLNEEALTDPMMFLSATTSYEWWSQYDSADVAAELEEYLNTQKGRLDDSNT